MENATKALIIAGSVLIVIIIIALGIKLVGLLNPAVEQVGETSTALEISIYNSQFLKFEGQQKGSAVRSLIRLVEQNNVDPSNNQIEIYKNNVKINDVNSIDVNHTYNVKFTDFTDEGYVKVITIE